ncbi:MAG: multicopper oxidase domain-containing protein, partial [Geobacteraceae bacterium]|nr:multicopper oxidase domain-containing protein [Geobacteraceae bacterium]
MAHAGPGTKAPPVNLPAPYGQFGTYYANSPSGVWSYIDPATGLPAGTSSDSGTPLRKFIDSLPGLGVTGANTMGNYIPIAVKGTNPVPGDPADYYEIELTDYNQQLHRDLPGPLNPATPAALGTKLRGYRDLNGGTRPYYLGPLILARSYDPTKAANTAGNGAPVRIKFVNNLGASPGTGDLFLPVDETAMGAGLGPKAYAVDKSGKVTLSGNTEKYRQNRAELHLHGGVTPWISDGTPHQWFTPVGDSNPANNSYPKGVSQQNVPDMPDPGAGAGTYYYSNQQSARLMFYHDHAFGLTRLNVYAGEAAGYLLVDKAEDDMIAAGVLPDQGGMPYTYGIPLVIQDKTFVPKDVAVQDAKWTDSRWGTYGDLWMSHVYEPNQNPADLSGANPYGRWDYGPWFWPPVTIGPDYVNLPSTGASNLSLTPESFQDTPVVNGAAYPYLTVEPKTYRFRILNAANDRAFNLQLYVSDPTSPDAFSSPLSGSTEVSMLPAAKWPKCTALSVPATPTVPLMCSCTATYSPKGCTPATWPTDGRDGGAPDPQFIGPSIIQIGTEGGLLPSPVVIPNQPVNYDYNRRNIVVLDILQKSLLLAPAERADVLIDFSNFANKTIILYNDAPAPMPAFDARYDYFSNGMDQTANGGAPTTLPGFGPNTRTIMQFRVGSAANGAAIHYLDANNVPIPAAMNTLTSAINAAFAATQPKPIVPESAYNAVYGTSSPDMYSTIFDTSLTFTPVGSLNPPATYNFLSKAIQELWDPFGRMNATLGVELPMTNNRIQTTIPYGYIDPPTEIMNDDGTPILWKITHNGVDTHPVHFHLYDVQLINRVGWDGAIRPPDANELGWKETVRMKPLEDVVVAFRPTLPKLPFGLPKSRRLLDPSFPEGAVSTVDAAGTPIGLGPVFMNILPDGNPTVQANVMTDFDHEYVWHCHILGHEENDFMRAQIITDTSVVPDPFVLSFADVAGTVNLTWVDNTPTSNPATMGNPKNEIGFRVERNTNGAGFVQIGSALANATTFSDATRVGGNSYSYRVIAFNAAGGTASNIVSPIFITTASLLNGTVNASYNQTLAVTGGTGPYSWGATGLPANLMMSSAGVISGTPTYVVPTTATSATFAVTVTVQDSTLTSTSKVLNLTINQIAPAAPVITQPVVANANFVWSNVLNESGYNVMRATVTGGVTGAYAQIGSVLADVTTF